MMRLSKLLCKSILLLFCLALFTTAEEKGPGAYALKAPEPSEAPKIAKKDIQDAIKQAQEFLKKNQNKDGSWGSARNTKGLNIYAPVPGAHKSFKSAATAIAYLGLLETDPAGYREELKKCRQWLFENLPDVKRDSADTIYNVWTHCFAIEALLRMRDKDED